VFILGGVFFLLGDVIVGNVSLGGFKFEHGCTWWNVLTRRVKSDLQRRLIAALELNINTRQSNCTIFIVDIKMITMQSMFESCRDTSATDEVVNVSEHTTYMTRV